ncbi:MAG: addiction module protein [Verrucomicrobiota bacterium]
MSFVELQTVVSDLPEKERGSSAAWLLESLPPHAGKDGSAEASEEAARRREELDSGRVQALSSDAFWAAVDEDRKAWK